MDSKVIKEKLIKELWPSSAAKFGEEYRTLVYEINKFISIVNNDEHGIQWLPFDNLDDEVIVKIGKTFINRNKANKYIFTNIDKIEAQYDFSDISIKSETGTPLSELRLTFENDPEYKALKKVDIEKTAIRLKKLIRNANDRNWKKALYLIKYYCRVLYNDISYEVKFFLKKGYVYDNRKYLLQLISMFCDLVPEILLAFVMLNPIFTDKSAILHNFICYSDAVRNTSTVTSINARKQFIQQNDGFYKECKCNMLNAAMVLQRYTDFLSLRNIYGEMERIGEILEAEMAEDISSFYPKGLENITNTKQMYDIVCTQNNITRYNEKFKKIEEISEISKLCGNNLISTPFLCSGILYLEFFERKGKYKRKKAMTLLGEILDVYKTRTGVENNSADDIISNILETETGFGISKSYLTFLDMKIYRGYICEKGMAEQYGIYNSVCGILREALLRCYYPIDFQLVYATAFDVFFDFLDCIYNVIETRTE